MTEDERERLRALYEAATPGPWEAAVDSHAPWNGKRIAWVETTSTSCPVADVPNSDRARADAAFIATARTAVPALLDENARLREAIERTRSALIFYATFPGFEDRALARDALDVVRAALAEETKG